MPQITELHERKTILIELLGETPQIRLIDFFMDNPLFDFTKKEIIEELGMNKRTLYKVLPKFEEDGLIVVSRKIGKAKLYKLNRKNPVIKYLRQIEKTHFHPDGAIPESGKEIGAEKPNPLPQTS